MTDLTDELIRNPSTDTLFFIRRDLRSGFNASVHGGVSLEEAQSRFSDDLCNVLEKVADTIRERE